ncbi:MAG: hypothetical protein HW419_2876 [Deltaproteobacteria bacterium]|nr:hypothetical protein [Deltaproteobacteria bacterium]
MSLACRIGLPVSAAMPDSQDFHRVIFYAVDEQVRGISNDPLAGT